MHAKNISFMRKDDGSVALSPTYDIAMHLHHGRDNRRSALDINGKFLMNDITIADVITEGLRWRIPERRARNVVNTTVEELAAALGDIDRDDHPGVPVEAWEIVEARTHKAADPNSGPVVDGIVGSRPGKKRGPRRPEVIPIPQERMSTRSTTKIKVSPGLIAPPAPRSP